MGDRPTILVVDDSPHMRRIVTRVLQHAGYDATGVEDGESALQLIETAPPDLIVLDVVLPGITGYEACRRIRANPSTAAIPVILLSALDSAQDRAAGFEAGADDYMTKPFEIAEFSACVARHLHRHAGARPSRLAALP